MQCDAMQDILQHAPQHQYCAQGGQPLTGLPGWARGIDRRQRDHHHGVDREVRVIAQFAELHRTAPRSNRYYHLTTNYAECWRKSGAPMMRHTIVIVGAGFSGTVLAANLLRRPPSGATDIVLIERGAEMGRGVAYAAREFPYLLNVPAGRLSADSHEPEQFLRYAQRRLAKAGS